MIPPGAIQKDLFVFENTILPHILCGLHFYFVRFFSSQIFRFFGCLSVEVCKKKEEKIATTFPWLRES